MQLQGSHCYFSSISFTREGSAGQYKTKMLFLGSTESPLASMNWALLFGTSVVIYLSWSVLALGRNYMKARKSGFQIYVSLANPSNPLWLLFGANIVHLFVRRIPDTIWRRIKYTVHGWEFAEQKQRNRLPEKVIMMVTAGGNELWIEDPDLAVPIMSRSKDFFQGEVTKRLIGIFGPNVMTTDGHDWQRHRRFVAQALNENISPLVWDESQRQATQMITHHLEKDQGKTDQTVAGLRNIAFNALASAGYGISNSWFEEQQKSPSHELSYSEVLNTLTVGFILIAVLPISFLRLKVLPTVVRKIGLAAQEFPIYTREMIEQERQLSVSAAQQRKNFMSSMVRMSDGERDKTKKSMDYLSEDEIQGNLFQFTLAGFDTTANTLAYAIALLAVHREWQEWILEEIDSLVKKDESQDYAYIFPKLKRCLAVMYETLRLYTPLSNVGRHSRQQQSLDTPSGNYIIPAGTRLYISFARLHTDPEYWGEDVSQFRPSRWISKDESSNGQESIETRRGMFMPWGEASRKCPGMKMAQVEFLSVIYTLFRSATVRPAIEAGETQRKAEERILAAVSDSMPRVTLQMNHPERVNLVWSKRRLRSE